MDNHIKEKTRSKTKNLTLIKQTNSNNSMAFGLAALLGALCIAGLNTENNKELELEKTFNDLFAYGFYENTLHIIPKSHPSIDFYYNPVCKLIKNPTLTNRPVLQTGNAVEIAAWFKESWQTYEFKKNMEYT